MNWSHFNTLLWLRYRLTVNHIRRYGALNLMILSIASGLALVGSITGFFLAMIMGVTFLRDASPTVLMYVFDGWLLGFLFFWTIGVMTDLQRGEMLSLDKLLHLPTTLAEVFVFNFLSSLVALTTLSFLPPMLGVCIAVVVSKGPAALVLFPLVATFVLMVAAVTYQFRGWLATLMANKRRQRAIIVTLTFFFVLVMQTPQLINLAVQRQWQRSRTESAARRDALTDRLRSGQITREQYEEQMKQKSDPWKPMQTGQLERIVDIANMVLPIGWLAAGAKAASAGNPWPGLAGALGMGGIAAYCLRRSYRTTLRYFTGDDVSSRPLPAAVAVPKTPARTGANRIEWALPFVPEPSAAIACVTLTSLLRAPEVKMTLLGPLVMLLIFGAMLIPGFGANGLSETMRSLLPLGVMGLSLSGLMQLSQNIFGFDRTGFRAYVLSGVPRHEILIGKNLAVAPLVMVPSVLMMIFVQIFAPAPVSGFAAALVVLPTVYLLLCLLGNFSSMLCPIGQPAGSMKPANLSGVAMLLQFVFMATTASIVSAAALIPLGAECLVDWGDWLPEFIPVAFIVAVLELLCSVLLYLTVIQQQGHLLQSRECRILDAVVAKGE